MSRRRRRCRGSGCADTVLKASVGRAVRMPTVAELYGATSTTNSQFINDPNLQAREVVDGELSAEKDLGSGRCAATAVRRGHARRAVFADDVRRRREPQRQPGAERRPHRAPPGWRLACSGKRRGWSRASTSTAASPTPTRRSRRTPASSPCPATRSASGSRTSRAGAPRALASYRFDDRWTRRARRALQRPPVPHAEQLRRQRLHLHGRQQVLRRPTCGCATRSTGSGRAAFGIDNLNNYQYWNFHPYPQRSYSAELKFDL